MTVAGQMIYLPDADPCNPGSDADIRGRLVLVEVGACSYERQYGLFEARGALALLVKDRYRPGGVFHFLRDGPAPLPGRMLFVQIYADPIIRDVMQEAGRGGLRVRLDPDPNPWVEIFLSWRWQVFLRWLPCAAFSLITVLAWTFLYQHAVRIRAKVTQATPVHARTRRRLLQRACARVSSVHGALALLALVSPMIAVGRGLGGSFSHSALPAPYQRLLLVQMSGYTSIATVMASSVWAKARLKSHMEPSRFVVVRCLTGEYGVASLALYTLMFVNETMISALTLTYAERGRPWVLTLSAMTSAVLGLWITAQTAAIALEFRSYTQTGTVSAYVSHVRRLMLGLGISATVFFAAIAVIAVRDQTWTPQGLTTPFAIYSVTHAIGCIFLVQLFRPGNARQVPE